jgi:ribosomal protein S18 acetylase RimI-like enzyme
VGWRVLGAPFIERAVRGLSRREKVWRLSIVQCPAQSIEGLKPFPTIFCLGLKNPKRTTKHQKQQKQQQVASCDFLLFHPVGGREIQQPKNQKCDETDTGTMKIEVRPIQHWKASATATATATATSTTTSTSTTTTTTTTTEVQVSEEAVTAVRRIWCSGLQQTIDEGPWYMKPLLAHIMPKLEQQATTQGPKGDLYDAASLQHHWIRPNHRAFFVAVAIPEKEKAEKVPTTQLDEDEDTTESGDQQVVVGDVEEEDEEIVGCIAVRTGTSESSSENGDNDDNDSSSSTTSASVYRLSVSTTHRHCGIGSKLMAAAESWARDQAGKSEMVLVTGNPVAQKFYTTLGYQRVPWYESLAPSFRKSLVE